MSLEICPPKFSHRNLAIEASANIRAGFKKKARFFVVFDYEGGGARRKWKKTTKLFYKLYFFLEYSRMMNIYRGASAWRAESLPIFENPKFAHQNLDIESCPPKFSHRNFYTKTCPSKFEQQNLTIKIFHQNFSTKIFPSKLSQ